jgi:hypothetical protein
MNFGFDPPKTGNLIVGLLDEIGVEWFISERLRWPLASDLTICTNEKLSPEVRDVITRIVRDYTPVAVLVRVGYANVKSGGQVVDSGDS